MHFIRKGEREKMPKNVEWKTTIPTILSALLIVVFLYTHLSAGDKARVNALSGRVVKVEKDIEKLEPVKETVTRMEVNLSHVKEQVDSLKERMDSLVESRLADREAIIKAIEANK